DGGRGVSYGGSDAEGEQGDQGEVEDLAGRGAQHRSVGQGQRWVAVAGPMPWPGRMSRPASRDAPTAMGPAARTVLRRGIAVSVTACVMRPSGGAGRWPRPGPARPRRTAPRTRPAAPAGN